MGARINGAHGANPKWSAEINPVRAKIHLPNYPESLQMGKGFGAFISR